MTVHLVGAGPGDPGLITVRGAELLARADVVVHDRLVTPALLDLVPPSALVVDVGKGPGIARRQQEITELLVEHGRRGATVVRLKGGDPFVFGRGGEEVEALVAAGVPVEVVPGVSAAIAAPAAAGVPVTHRGLSTSVTVVTGHGGGDGDGDVDWPSLAAAGGTLVVLMGVETRASVARALVAGGRDPGTPVAVVQWGTTGRQRTVRTTLAALDRVDVAAPSAIVVGPVAALALGSIEGRPLHGMTVVVTRPRTAPAALPAALAAAGASVVPLPVTEVVGPADGGAALRGAVATIGRYRWVAFTSANAVAPVLDLLRDARDLAGVRVAAVGPATAAALAERNIVADLVAAGDASGTGLAAAMPPPGPDAPADAPAPGGDAPGAVPPPAAGAVGAAGVARVLFPRAAGARRELPEALAAKGWLVDEVEAYRTVAVPAEELPPAALAAAREATVVVLAAPSAVAATVAVLGPACPPAACIGRTTADAARRAGLAVVAVAASPTPDALVAALADWWGGRRGDASP